jgi:hypothetical protein
MGNIGFQEMLFLAISALCFALPIVLIVWVYRIYQNSKENVKKIAELEIRLLNLEVKLK